MYKGPIVDTHFHVFKRSDTPQEGLLAAHMLQRDFTMADYRAAIDEADVRAAVALNVIDRDFGERELAFIEGVAARDTLIARYIPFCPVDKPQSVDAIARLAAHPLVAGIRYNQVVRPDGTFVSFDAAVRGAEALARHRLVFEASVRPWQHQGLLKLVRETPRTTYVLGHLGKPRITLAAQPDWEAGIRAFSELPNVFCKVTPAIATIEDPPFTAELIAPLVRFVVDQFGYDRIVLGSNFPTSSIAIASRDWFELLDTTLGDVEATALDKLYRRNAQRLYQIDVS